MNKISKLCLGTVQLGLDYGVANREGKPSLEKSLKILDFACERGIRWFDTAQAYGNAEEVLGEYLAHRGNLSEFHLISKLVPKAFEEGSECVCFYGSSGTKAEGDGLRWTFSLNY